jgi:hypothetical protein
LTEKEGKMANVESWSYKEHEIKEGLKPKGRHFQYFFVVSKKGEKRCNYCVWIDDANLTHFSASRSFDEILSSRREEWVQWVRQKIDQEDFRNIAWKLEKTGKKEIKLEELTDKLEPE